MAISDTIQSMRTNVSNAYDKISDKGGTLPINKNLANLEDAIDSIPLLFKSLVNRSITTVTAEDLQGVTSIGNYAFWDCSNLTSITIPDSVTSIGNRAFASCYALTSVTIGGSVTSIRDYAFYYCTGLKRVTIGNSVTSIRDYAFYNCYGLTSITIPDSVTSIGSSAFYNCSGLTSITINATTPPTLASANAFNNTNNCPIYVPAESVNAYKTATNWSSLADRIFAIQE